MQNTINAVKEMTLQHYLDKTTTGRGYNFDKSGSNILQIESGLPTSTLRPFSA